MNKKVSLIGIGFVGGALKKSFEEKNINLYCYDKFNDKFNSFEECLNSEIMFLCLPTPFDTKNNEYDKSSINEICLKLDENKYQGLVIIKSTIESEVTISLSNQYPKLKLIHNPEFLTASTAYHDFHNQKHIVIGKGPNVNESEINVLKNFYNTYYPDAEISICNSTESESMKLFVNCFYSVKIQFFNELFLLCSKFNDCDYNNVVNLMLKNGWINSMHTQVPGTDGKLSYGGFCFPKDTNALLNLMKRNESKCKVLESTVKERNEMRDDHTNIIKKE